MILEFKGVEIARGKYGKGKVRSKNISALQFFTDREEERAIIKRFFEYVMDPEKRIEKPILHFYGVGGAGKSSLVKKSIEEWHEESQSKKVKLLKGFKKTPNKLFKVALVDFDTTEAEKNYTPAHVLWDIRSALARSGIMMYYFDALYAIYWAKTRDGQDSNLDLSPLKKLFDFGAQKNESISNAGGSLESFIPESWVDAFGGIFDVVDEVTGSAKVGLGGAKLFASLRSNEKIKQLINELNFDDLHVMEALEIKDLLDDMPEIFAKELAYSLQEQNVSLALVIDGFERIHQNIALEKAIQAFVSFSALDDDEQPTSKMGVVILGREKLKWSKESLDDARWPDLTETHRLGGLAEEDAKAFLSKAIRFEEQEGRAIVAGTIEKHMDTILAACSETEEENGYHPYYIDLAINMVRARGEKFDASKHLGGSPEELQNRFFKYMNEKDKQLHLIFAILLRFDWQIIESMIDKKLIMGLTKLDFEAFMRHHSYVIEYTNEQGLYRLHRLMQQSLVDSCKNESDGLNDAQTILEDIQAVFFAKLQSIEKLDDIQLEHEEAYFHFLGIMYMALEQGLWSEDTFDSVSSKLPEPFEEAYFSERTEYLRRILAYKKAQYGDKHPSVATSLNNLASVLESQGKYDEAEVLFRESLAMRQALLGDKHPSVATSLNNLAGVLNSQGKYDEAEVLYRESLAMRQALLGDQHPDTISTRNDLVDILKVQGKYDKSEFNS